MANPSSDRSRVRRLPARAAYGIDTIHAIIDAAPLCSLGFLEDGLPLVIPVNHGRLGETVVIHGARASRLMRAAASGAPLCLSFSMVDALVLARSAFHHSVNYRSVVAFGTGQPVLEDDGKLAALRAITERTLPGRWDEVRPPSEAELAATAVVAITIDEASAKTRTGPPVDGEEDIDPGVWAGIVPVPSPAGIPVPDAVTAPSTPLPGSIRALLAHRSLN